MYGLGALAITLAAIHASAPNEPLHRAAPRAGIYKAWLDSPGGTLHFGLELTRDQATGSLAGWLINGDERVRIPRVVTSDDSPDITFEFTHYNAAVTARASDDRNTLEGQWRKRQGLDAWTTLPFHAERIRPVPYATPAPRNANDIAGRWAVSFSSSDDPAVAVFTSDPFGDGVRGTFMTTTGDYRFLAGSVRDDQLMLSVFDGAHAFLFKAIIQEDGSLRGDFWSRDVWHETWTAVRDPEAALPDAFGTTAWDDSVEPGSIMFRALDGKRISPFDDRFAGNLRIIEVFGTWCPNCNDATGYLMQLDARYRARGVSIVGLAFEVTGDFEVDRAQIRRYIDHHGIAYPILHCGIHDKDAASIAFPVLDRVRAYPTFIFLDRNDTVRAIYTGFSGPATGPAHQKLREDFERIIETVLNE